MKHLSQNANDKKEVAPAIDALMEATGMLPDKFSGDNGYMSGGGNIGSLNAAELMPILPPKRARRKTKSHWLNQTVSCAKLILYLMSRPIVLPVQVDKC